MFSKLTSIKLQENPFPSSNLSLPKIHSHSKANKCKFPTVNEIFNNFLNSYYKQEQVIGTYVYSQKHNYIPYSTFTITTVQLHVSAISVGHLQVVHEAPYDKLYLHLSGGTVCGVGWVQSLVLCL